MVNNFLYNNLLLQFVYMKGQIVRFDFLLLGCMLVLPVTSELKAQEQFKGEYINEELKIKLKLNLFEADIPVPGFELDSCYGYLQGSINGSWLILKVVSVKGNQAEVRTVSEKGSDAQNLLLTLSDSSLTVRQKDDVNIKGVKGRKYVKLPKEIVFTK